MDNNLLKIELQSLFPLIKIIELGSSYYIFDAKSGLLANVNLSEINLIYQYCKNPANVNIPDYLQNFFNKGVFTKKQLKQITPNKDEIKEIVEKQLNEKVPETLIIEVTEKCNLRCRYCFFTQEEGFKNRQHSFNNIDEITAFKAIDYYYNRYVYVIKQASKEKVSAIKAKTPPRLQWWGGEPFQAFDVILKTKLYFESLGWEQYGISKDEIVFGLTSNLTVFNEEILNFLVTNNIKLKVSLDGDLESHNKNRVYYNEKGTFETVMRNLNIIINRYPEYAKYNVGIQSVLADNINVYQAQHFIESYFKLNTKSNKLVTNLASPQRKKHAFFSEIEIIKDSIDDIIFSFRNK
jgi:uncharacterized protein